MAGDETAADLARCNRGAMIAPAGCGKTWSIARAVTDHGRGRELVLTHTHAGVDALRRRLQEFRCKPASVHVDTIAGWCLRLTAAFPQTSRISTSKPRTNDEYAEVYIAAASMLRLRPFRRILQASYTGVYVDEYQDCMVDQHSVVLSLAEALPCRVIGDPLQSIFNFGSRPVVNWDANVQPLFAAIPSPSEPWRWLKTNPALGRWLLRIRPQLEQGQPIELCGAPVQWRCADDPRFKRQVQVDACFSASRDNRATVVAIHNQPPQANDIASRLKGLFSCVEVMDLDELYSAAKQIDESHGAARALAVLDFAERCATRVAAEMRVHRTSLANGKPSRSSKHLRQRAALDAVSSFGTAETVAQAIAILQEIPDARLFRRELVDEMHRACRAVTEKEAPTLSEAAWIVRNRTRQRGRRMARCAVGTTLRVKGLEFDHAVVLDTSAYDAANLYVALTRASKSLTVVAANSVIQPRPTNS